MLIDLLRRAYYLFPDEAQRAILVKRRERIWIDRRIVFIHIPKAAGTSINQALFGRFMGHVHASDVERWGSRQLKSLPSFAVTRNPWDRLVSAYRFARLGRGFGGPIHAGIRRWEQYQAPEFETFESFVTNWLARHDLRRLDGIFQPQWPFVCGANRKVLVDHLGRLDELSPTLDFIAASTGVRVDIQRSNRSGSDVNYREFYTPQLAEAVAAIYREDINLFGYEF
jgi:hypothetical protein